MHLHGYPAILDGDFDELALTVAGNKSAATAPLKVSFEKNASMKRIGSLVVCTGQHINWSYGI